MADNPFGHNPHYKTDGQWVRDEHGRLVRDKLDVVPEVEEDNKVETGGISITTQDVKSDEVTTDEPKKRRTSRKRKESTDSSSESTES